MPVFGHCSKSSHNPGLFWTTVLLDTNLEMISKKKCATIGFSFWIISQSIAKSKNSSNDQRISLRTLNMNHSSYCVFCAYNDFPTEILVWRGNINHHITHGLDFAVYERGTLKRLILIRTKTKTDWRERRKF